MRRATYLRQARTADPKALVVDTGGTLVGGDGTGAQGDELLVRAMAAMGYDALNAGQGELKAGSLALRQLADPKAPALIASASSGSRGTAGQTAGGGQVAPKAYLIREVSGVRVGVVGVTSPGPAPAEALAALLPEVRRQADVVVALADLEPDEVKALAAAGLDLDVILGARSVAIRDASRDGRAIVASAGPDGQYVGRLTLAVDAQGKVASFQGETVPLDDSVSADPDLARLRTQYR